MYPVARSLLFLLPPEAAHRATLHALAVFGNPAPGRALLRATFAPPALPRLQSTVFGLSFAHPIGLAAGLDKNGEAIAAWEAMGFGFVEVGTVTPKAQAGNPQPRLFRLPLDRALINRMGFNNHGAEAMAEQLARPHAHPLGINLGKNKTTPLENAAQDYLASFRTLYDRGDYFVVNVSSPNTAGLRSLQTLTALEDLIRPLVAERDQQPFPKPILVKLSVDLPLDDAQEIARLAKGWGLDGLIAANTTLSRVSLRSPFELRQQEGGLSGAPVKAPSTALIRALASATRLPIIGVGGVFSAEDAYAKVRAGASLVQLYTGFIYGGPALPGRIARDLDAMLERDGYAHLADAVGADLTSGA